MNVLEREKIVHQVVEEIYEAYPYLWDKFGENGRKRTTEDNYHHLDHLATAHQMDDVTFFLDYTEWLERVLTSRGVSTNLIIDNYERLWSALPVLSNEAEKEKYQSYLLEGINRLKQPKAEG